jgi:hypothetical protein
VLDETEGGLKHGRVGAAQLEDLAPPPLAGVNASAFGDDVGAHLVGQFRDLGSLGMGGVVLPQPDHGVQVVLEFGKKTERRSLAIDRDGGGAGGVDTDTDHLGGLKPGHTLGCLGQRPLGHRLQSIEVILRVLARDVRILGVEKDAELTRRVGKDGGTDFGSIFEIHEKGTAGVGAVVNAECVLFRHAGWLGWREPLSSR